MVKASNKKHLKNVLVLGSGVAAKILSNELLLNSEWKILGFLDDDLTKHGQIIDNIPILGPLHSLPYWVSFLDIKKVVLAIPSATKELRKKISDICKSVDVDVFSIPTMDELLKGAELPSQIKHIEIEDLLGRLPIQLDNIGLTDFLKNQVIFVTGAGGSIGSELCRQISIYSPFSIIFFESNEFALYKIQQEFLNLKPSFDCNFILGDIKDSSRVNEIFEKYKPTIVFHAAAYKHVPMLDSDNAWQAILNNVYGTWVVASIAQKKKISKFVLISTDKAVNPTNVMGASKRLAEKICQALQSKGVTNFVIVRFGNVLGSSGSVIPKFREQISKGGPLTITHPEITRYFMSISEAAQLVLQAGMMGYKAQIFVLDMGEPIKIFDLAKNLIRLSGIAEEKIEIIYTGLRPGEKLYEELLADHEITIPTPHNKLRIAKSDLVVDPWLKNLLVWIDSSVALDHANVKVELMKWVPEFKADFR